MTQCKQCRRPIKVGGYRVVRKGAGSWLCGSARCERAYAAEGPPPTGRKRVKEIVGGIPLVEKGDVGAATATPKRVRFVPTDDDVARVLKLRETGLAFHKISAEMGWKEDIRGCRAYKIVKSV